MSKFELNVESLLEAIKMAESPISKRDLARIFGLRDAAKIELKRLLKKMQEAGMIEQLPTRCYVATDPEAKDKGGRPSVMILRVTEVTLDGDVYAAVVAEEDSEDMPARILVEPGNHEHGAPGIDDRVLCQIKYRKDGSVSARVMRKLGAVRDRLVLGRAAKAAHNTWWLQPVNRKEREDYMLAVPMDQQDALEHGALVEAIVEDGKALKRPRARLHAIIGHDDDPKAISLIALHEQGLRVAFPEAVIEQTADMVVPALGKREDLRKIPLVTIDGADARDFDDAVFAEKNEDGFHLIVAIADVAHYVTPGSPLDREAYKRGNSTYFPDRVLPMLPEKLSNDLCSLRPKEDRACLAMHMQIDMEGKLQSYKVVRGLMKSVARLTYDQVQAAFDGVTDATTEILLETVLNPLREAYKILDGARQKRGALDLDMPERQILIDAKGNMTGVRKRARFDSHKLVEEFMILANVAAAMALEAKSAPCIYRIHDTPSSEKLDSARSFLEGFGLNLTKGAVVKPALFNGLLKKVEGKDFAPLVNQVILRSQAQAVYHPDNIGHFGLALQKYAHFTSPIRRYADLVVHRSLIRAYGLGDGGLEETEVHRIHETADHISQTERNSMEAERASVDRFTAAWLASRVGESFTGRISGVTRFGLFVSLDETGADGLVPIRMLPQDYYIHSEEQHALIGRRTGRLFRLCAPVRVRVVEADRLTGSSVFELENGEQGAEVPGYHGRKMHLSAPRGDRRDKKHSSRHQKPKNRGNDRGGKHHPTKQKHKNRHDD
ncbi:MAG TPA: ribonuclease R [Alphaproteobacteria bacterium]